MQRTLWLLSAIATITTSLPSQSPTPAEVVARHVAASGGKEALARHASLSRQATMKIEAMGIEGTYRIERRQPSAYRQTTEMQPVGVQEQGFDGTRGWDVAGAAPPKWLTGTALEDRQRTADYFNELRTGFASRYDAAVTRGTWEGCDCWRLTRRTASGKTATDYYNATTGLYHGSAEEVQSAVGPLERITLVRSYGTYEGVTLPAVIVQRLPQFETVITFEQTTFGTIAEGAIKAPAGGG